jgi:hypothetical protein
LKVLGFWLVGRACLARAEVTMATKVDGSEAMRTVRTDADGHSAVRGVRSNGKRKDEQCDEPEPTAAPTRRTLPYLAALQVRQVRQQQHEGRK